MRDAERAERGKLKSLWPKFMKKIFQGRAIPTVPGGQLGGEELKRKKKTVLPRKNSLFEQLN